MSARPASRDELLTLRSRVHGSTLTAGDDGFEQSTSPLNSSASQRPAVVVVAEQPSDVAAAIEHARAIGARVAAQSSGHGAAGVLDDEVVLIDTSRLNDIEIDPGRRRARVGAGVAWQSLTAAAEPHGLYGLAGSAPTVGVAGYTFQGGVGWMVREHGLASARLLAVDYVDAVGEMCRADAGCDPEALWAFRGGDGVGIATSLEFELVPVTELWAGFLLLEAEQMPDVVSAWSHVLDGLPRTISTTIGMRKAAPPIPAIPEEVHGRAVTYLGLCSSDVESGRRLTETLRRALPRTLVNATGTKAPTDLAEIHLDPPAAIPALGEGRFLTQMTTRQVTDVLLAGAITEDGPLGEIEIRHLDGATTSDVDGALTSAPGPFLLHAAGDGGDATAWAATEARLATVLHTARTFDTGQSASGFRDGQTTALDALTTPNRDRLRHLRVARDPDGRLLPARELTLPATST